MHYIALYYVIYFMYLLFLEWLLLMNLISNLQFSATRTSSHQSKMGTFIHEQAAHNLYSAAYSSVIYKLKSVVMKFESLPGWH